MIYGECSIIAAIRDHNPELAEKLMRSHIRKTRDEFAETCKVNGK